MFRVLVDHLQIDRGGQTIWTCHSSRMQNPGFTLRELYGRCRRPIELDDNAMDCAPKPT